MTLPEIKQQAQELALEDLQEALDFLRTELPEDSPVASTVLSMLRRLKRAAKNHRKGLISLEDMEIIENQIFENLLELLGELDEQKLEQGTDAGMGRILYDIPPKMVVDDEVRCRVRLAFIEEVVRQNLEVTDSMEIHPIQISEVMSVELVDPGSQPVFSIRTISDEIQRIDPDFPSEWWFYVTAIQEGHHALVLRVSLIEQIDGVDRKRNIVLEEVIDIVEEAPAEIPSGEFRTGPYLEQAAAGSGTDESFSPAPPPPPPPGSKVKASKKESGQGPIVINPAPLVDIPGQPRPTPAPHRKSRLATINRWVMYTVIGFAVFTAASYAMMPGVRSELNWWMAGDSKSDLEEYINEFPESPRAEEAIKRISELELEKRRQTPDEQVPEMVVPDSEERGLDIQDPGLNQGPSVVGGGLSDREVLSKPDYDSQVSQRGSILVKVCVDAAGDVTRASFSPQGSNLADQQLQQVAVKNAKKWKFAKSANDQECGTIRFEFGVD